MACGNFSPSQKKESDRQLWMDYVLGQNSNIHPVLAMILNELFIYTTVLTFLLETREFQLVNMKICG